VEPDPRPAARRASDEPAVAARETEHGRRVEAISTRIEAIRRQALGIYTHARGESS